MQEMCMLLNFWNLTIFMRKVFFMASKADRLTDDMHSLLALQDLRIKLAGTAAGNDYETGSKHVCLCVAQ